MLHCSFCNSTYCIEYIEIYICAVFKLIYKKREDSAPINQEILLPKEEVDDLLNSLVQIPGQDYLISKFQVTQ